MVSLARKTPQKLRSHPLSHTEIQQCINYFSLLAKVACHSGLFFRQTTFLTTYIKLSMTLYEYKCIFSRSTVFWVRLSKLEGDRNPSRLREDEDTRRRTKAIVRIESF